MVLDTAPTGYTILLLDAALAYHRELSWQSNEIPESVQKLLIGSEGKRSSAGRTTREELVGHTSCSRDRTRLRAQRSKVLLRPRERTPDSPWEVAPWAKRLGFLMMTDCGNQPARPRPRSL